MNNLTPLMKQYMDIKKNYPDAILLFRLGDFYEAFSADAKVVSKELDIVLTSRLGMPMAGVPYHAVMNYVRKLVSAGYKVAICDQMEDPSLAKGLVRREVTRVITPGTAIDEELVESSDNIYTLSLMKGESNYAIAYVDISTGDAFTTSAQDENPIFDEISRIMPKQILLQYELKDLEISAEIKEYFPNTAIEFLEDWYYSDEQCRNSIKRVFKSRFTSEFGFDKEQVKAIGMLLTYLLETQKRDMSYLHPFRIYRIDDTMIIDRNTLRNLEISFLLERLDETVTPMGKRLLKRYILSPSTDTTEINHRLDVVETFYKNRILLEEIREYLMTVKDLERLVSRLNFGTISPRAMITLKNSLKAIPYLKKALLTEPMLSSAGEQLEECQEAVDIIERAIVDSPPATLKDGGVIREGYDAELDEMRRILNGGERFIEEYQERERAKTGIKNLKIGFNKVYGYYIEVNKSQVNKVPKDYVRKQTLVGTERYITADLKEEENKVLHARERILQLEERCYQKVRYELMEFSSRIQKNAKIIAKIDVLSNFARIALQYNYIRPIVDETNIMEIREGRHPVIEGTVEGRFVPNDLFMDNEENRFIILTGPNMSGKSTYIRQVALITIMAQAGSFVPAKYTHLGVVDRVFTRIGARDDISSNRSTFFVEMEETSDILNNATENSLIVLDEIGRGTSTFDGISIAWAVSEYINNALGAKTLFATHYNELTELANCYRGFKNYTILVKEHGEEVEFTHRVVEGATDKSYGVEVAELAGLPNEVTQRAREVLKTITEKKSLDKALRVLNEEDMKRLRERKARISRRRRKHPRNIHQISLFNTSDDSEDHEM